MKNIYRKNLEGNTTGRQKCLLQSGMIMVLSFIYLLMMNVFSLIGN